MASAKLSKLVGDLKDKFGDDSVMFAADIPLEPPIS